MSKITTILLAFLAIAAIVFLAIYEPLTRSSREEEITMREGVVMQLDPAKIRVIRITAGDKDLEIRRRGNGWQLGTKSKDRADSELVGQVLAAAANLQFFDRMADREFKSKDDLSDYGLLKPKRKIEFEGDKKTTLYLGKDAANEDRLYVRTDDSKDVYLVSDKILSIAFRDAGEFRDRKLTDLNPDQVDRLIIRRSDGEIELGHDATGWQINKPLHARADAKKVDEYLKRLLSLRIVDFVAEDSGDLSSYGLTEGQNEITFFAEGTERHQTLRLGKGKTGELFGQFTARDSVYRMPAATMDLLKIEPDELRDRHLLSFNPDIVDMIRIRTPQREFVIRRNASGWELKDGSSTRSASEAAVLALWNALADVEVSAYMPATGVKLKDFGLETPLCRVELLSVLSENTPETKAGEQLIAGIDFGKSPDGKLHARISDSVELATIPADVLKSISLDPGLWASPK